MSNNLTSWSGVIWGTPPERVVQQVADERMRLFNELVETIRGAA